MYDHKAYQAAYRAAHRAEAAAYRVLHREKKRAYDRENDPDNERLAAYLKAKRQCKAEQTPRAWPENADD